MIRFILADLRLHAVGALVVVLLIGSATALERANRRSSSPLKSPRSSIAAAMKNLRLFSKVNHTASLLGIHSVSQAQRELVLGPRCAESRGE